MPWCPMIFLMRQVDPGHDATAGGRMPERVPAHPLNPRLPQPRLKGASFKGPGLKRMVGAFESWKDKGRREKSVERSKDLFFAPSLKGTCRVFPPSA